MPGGCFAVGGSYQLGLAVLMVFFFQVSDDFLRSHLWPFNLT